MLYKFLTIIVVLFVGLLCISSYNILKQPKPVQTPVPVQIQPSVRSDSQNITITILSNECTNSICGLDSSFISLTCLVLVLFGTFIVGGFLSTKT